MELREQLAGKSCFKLFVVPEWDTGGAEYSLRSLSSDEMASLSTLDETSESNNFDKGAKMFSLLFGNSVGKRVYGYSDDDLKEIRSNIPLLVISRVVVAGMEFNADNLKKN